MEHQIYVVLCTATTFNPLIDDQVYQNVAVGNPFLFFCRFFEIFSFLWRTVISRFCGTWSFLNFVLTIGVDCKVWPMILGVELRGWTWPIFNSVKHGHFSIGYKTVNFQVCGTWSIFDSVWSEQYQCFDIKVPLKYLFYLRPLHWAPGRIFVVKGI